MGQIIGVFTCPYCRKNFPSGTLHSCPLKHNVIKQEKMLLQTENNISEERVAGISVSKSRESIENKSSGPSEVSVSSSTPAQEPRAKSPKSISQAISAEQTSTEQPVENEMTDKIREKNISEEGKYFKKPQDSDDTTRGKDREDLTAEKEEELHQNLRQENNSKESNYTKGLVRKSETLEITPEDADFPPPTSGIMDNRQKERSKDVFSEGHPEDIHILQFNSLDPNIHTSTQARETLLASLKEFRMPEEIALGEDFYFNPAAYPLVRTILQKIPELEVKFNISDRDTSFYIALFYYYLSKLDLQGCTSLGSVTSESLLSSAQERFRNLVVRYEDLYALFNLAYIFVEKKEYEKAFDLVDSSIKDAPVKLLAAYATMAARAGDRNRSEAIAKEIMRRPTPKDHLVAVSLATALSMVEETIPQAIIQLKNLLAEKPDYVPALIALARIYARTDALKAAYEYLKKALVISPHNFKALMLHAELELIRGTGSISSSHLKKDHLDEPSSESRSDTSSTTISNTAGVRFKDSEAEIEKHVSISALNNVIELAGKALISRPESVEPLLLQLKALRILGNYDKAKEIVVKLEAKELPNGMMFEVLKEWAHVLMDRKEFAAAKDIIEKALNIKEDYELKNLLKTAYFELGYEGKAVDIISKDGKASSSNDILLLARALVSEGKIEDAIRKLEEMLLYEPANADAAYQAARLYILTGRQPDARTLLEKALTLNPGDVRLLNELGLILLDLGDIDSAEAKFRLAAEKAAEKRGENGERLTNYYYPEFNLGLCAYKRGNKKTGIQMMEQAVRRSRMPDAAVANTLSLIYEEEGDIKSALMWLEISIEENLLQRIEKALSHDKDFSGYRESLQAFLDDPSLKQEFSKFWFRASILQNRLELYDEALSSADESLRGDPHNVPCWIERARAQLGLGRNKEALQTIRYARAIKPDSQYLLAMEAAVLKKLGDYEGAARIYRKLWM